MRTTFRLHTMLAALVTAAACGGTKEKAPEAAPVPPPATTPDSAAVRLADSTARAAAADSAKCAGADSVKCVATADSTRRANAKQAERPLRDSAFGPKFSVDSTGKVTPIKPPPPAAKKP